MSIRTRATRGLAAVSIAAVGFAGMSAPASALTAEELLDSISATSYGESGFSISTNDDGDVVLENAPLIVPFELGFAPEFPIPTLVPVGDLAFVPSFVTYTEIEPVVTTVYPADGSAPTQESSVAATKYFEFEPTFQRSFPVGPLGYLDLVLVGGANVEVAVPLDGSGPPETTVTPVFDYSFDIDLGGAIGDLLGF